MSAKKCNIGGCAVLKPYAFSSSVSPSIIIALNICLELDYDKEENKNDQKKNYDKSTTNKIDSNFDV